MSEIFTAHWAARRGFKGPAHFYRPGDHTARLGYVEPACGQTMVKIETLDRDPPVSTPMCMACFRSVNSDRLRKKSAQAGR